MRTTSTTNIIRHYRWVYVCVIHFEFRDLQIGFFFTMYSRGKFAVLNVCEMFRRFSITHTSVQVVKYDRTITLNEKHCVFRFGSHFYRELLLRDKNNCSSENENYKKKKDKQHHAERIPFLMNLEQLIYLEIITRHACDDFPATPGIPYGIWTCTRDLSREVFCTCTNSGRKSRFRKLENNAYRRFQMT